MKLQNITLEKWLSKPPDRAFRNGKRRDYYQRYSTLKTYCIDNIYNYVTAGANFQERGLYYNDHGLDHVETVIDRATDLVRSSSCELNAKEVYFLLCAILIHDVGMILGRKGHEKNTASITSNIRNYFSTDTIEQDVVYTIAKSHGGKTKYNSKDTIFELVEIKTLNQVPVRLRLLSSILRFSDELAENKKRANTILLNKGKLKKSPSEIFHAFSSCIDSIVIDHIESAIIIQFFVPINYLERTFKKLKKQEYLINEIYIRLVKIYLENCYIQKFTAKYFFLNKIDVNIEFIPPSHNPFDKSSNVPDPFKFTIENRGYPDEPEDGIYSLCPNLIVNKVKLDGKYYKTLI